MTISKPIDQRFCGKWIIWCMVYYGEISLTTSSYNAQGTIANSLTCVQLHKRAEKIAVMLMERGHLQDGDHVALVYPPGKAVGSDITPER